MKNLGHRKKMNPIAFLMQRRVLAWIAVIEAGLLIAQVCKNNLINLWFGEVTMIAAFCLLLQNFWRWWGPMINILSIYEYSMNS